MFTLKESLAALADRKEFLINSYDGLVCINYLVQLPDSFEGIRREFRGVTFDEVTGEIVSLPLHKFLNVNQAPETQWHVLQDQEGVIYEKIDGSMVHFFLWKGDLRASTRMSCQTDQAKDALRLAGHLGLTDDIVQEVRSGYTPIFEYVAPHNQIVVEYPRPRLVYLHSRCRNTGEYTRNPTYQDRAQVYDFKFSEILGHLDKTEFEGYVVRLDSGLWVKCKCPWYLERHRAVDALMRPAYRLYEVVFEGNMDDLIAVAPDRHKDRLRAIYNEAQLDLLRERERVLSLSRDIMQVASAGDPSQVRKTYALYAKANHPDLFGPLMRGYDGRDMDDLVKKRLMDQYKAKYPNRLFPDMEPEG